MKKTKKRLSIFLPGLYGGGAERVLLNLSEGLARQGYSVDLVLAQVEGPYLADVPRSVRLVGLNKRPLNALRTLASLPALVVYLRRERPDVLLSGLHASIIALWARRLAGGPQRVVICEHNTFSQQNQLLPRWYRAIMLQFVKWFYPWANSIVAVSKGVADDLAQVAKIPRDRIQVIYNPVVTPQLKTRAKDILEHKWFEPGQPPVVLAVGRLSEQKDFSTLIDAFAIVRRSRIARLLILGEGEDRPKLELLVKQKGLEQDIRMPGFVSNPLPYMVNAALFVLSSKWEGLPTVLVEALFSGVPIVATDCPSGPREILRDGQYGQLVPVGDVISLAMAIEAMLGKNPFCSHSENWHPYESETIVKQYKNILLGI